ncbi:unnamed protein product, partial [Penicillium palitans]
MAKKAMYDLFHKTTVAWPTIKSLMETSTEPVGRSASRGNHAGRGTPRLALPSAII